MNELFASIKAFIEKGNIIIFLLAIAVAIFTYQILAREILWAIFAFCLSYAAFYGIHNLYNNHKASLKLIEDNRRKQEAEDIRRQQEEAKQQKEKEQIDARLRTIYASLPDDIKEGLELLYNLPQTEGGFTNARVVQVENTEEYQKITNAYNQIRFFLNLENLMESQHGIQTQIITILPAFYNIIEEKAKEKGGNNG